MQNYEVIRFVQQQGKCHIVMDFVEGELLCNFLGKTDLLEKEFLLQMMIAIAKELENLERSNGELIYPCLTPLHIVVKKDRSIAFLKFSERYERQIGNRSTPFLSMDGTNNYIYSYGRTLQFILTKANCTPGLSWKEERKFKKIISKCLTNNSKKKYSHGRDIVNQLRPMKKKYIILLIPLLLTCIGLFSVFATDDEKTVKAEKIETEKFLQESLSDFLISETEYTEQEIVSFATEYEQLLGKDFQMSQGEVLLRVYYKLNTEFAKERAVNMGKILLDKVVENREILANIYMEQGKFEEAINEYEILIAESPSVERYLTLANLMEQSGRHEEAMSICEEGSKYDSKGVELQLQYVKLLLMNTDYASEEKQIKLETFLSLYPFLEEDNRYLQINQEINFQEVNNES